MSQTEKTALEKAIQDDARQVLENIARREADEIGRLDEAHAAWLQEFQKKMQDKTDAAVSLAASRAANRTQLDLKKLKLRSLDAFIDSVVKEAMQGIRSHPHYRPFLFNAVAQAVGLIPDGAEIHLGREDLALEGDIREMLGAKGFGQDVVIREDKRIGWGGCIIVDVSGGRVFDHSLERIYFKTSTAIRREVMKRLDDHEEQVKQGTVWKT